LDAVRNSDHHWLIDWGELLRVYPLILEPGNAQSTLDIDHHDAAPVGRGMSPTAAGHATGSAPVTLAYEANATQYAIDDLTDRCATPEKRLVVLTEWLDETTAQHDHWMQRCAQLLSVIQVQPESE